jgi:hypothetical protein
MRRIATLVLVTLLLPPLSVVWASAAEPHTVFISVSDTNVKVGQKVRISGSVLPQHARPLSLQMKYSGAWHGIARTMTTDSGRYSFTDTPSSARDRYYRVCKIGGSAVCSKAKLVRVKPAHPVTQPTISIAVVAAYELTTDDNYDISGTTSPDLVGRPVYLQLLDGAGTWTSISEPLTVRSDRTFRFSVPARQPGLDLSLRVFAPATTATKAAHANTDPFTVYGWYYLSDLAPTSSSKNWDKTGRTINMGGTPQRNSLRSLWSAASFGGWSTGFAEYNLSYRCRTFEAIVGVNDEAGTNAQWSFQTFADGEEVEHGFVGLGYPVSISRDVTSAFRLRVENDRLAGDPYQDYRADAVWGAARVLCAGKP